MTLADVVEDLAGHGATLLRAWPRSPDHLLLEVRHDGRTCAGQWFSEDAPARRVHAGTPGSERLGRVVLQPGGADRKLPGLAAQCSAPDAELVAHRPERRGVVREPRSGRTAFTKLVRPAALPRVVAAARSAQDLPLRTPQVLGVDDTRSCVTTDALPGVRLHSLLGTPRAEAACRATGRALAALHAVPVPTSVPVHGPAQETAVLQRWVRHAHEHGIALPEPHLTLPSAHELVLLHRDLHDKQVLVDDSGEVGVLDFDLVAAGDPALDLGNLLAHLDLRAAQGLVPDAAPLRAAVLQGYAPPPALMVRLPAHERATRLRLAAVYAFRPPWAAVVASMV